MRPGGFTLIELLLAMGIFSLLVSTTVASFRSGDDARALRFGSAHVAALIRNTASRAQAGRVVSICSGENEVCSASCRSVCVDESAPGGYGVHVEVGDSLARLFADLGASPDRARGADEDVETLVFDRTGVVTIAKIVTKNAAGENPVSSADMVFIPPKPTLWINTDQNISHVAITFSHARTGAIRTITVNAISGFVEEK